MRLAVTLGLALAGCYAAPPPPASVTDLTGCEPGAYGVRSELTCRSSDDCLLCGAPTGCGFVTKRESPRPNVACPEPDAEACRGRQAQCCGGRCVLSLGPPPL